MVKSRNPGLPGLLLLFLSVAAGASAQPLEVVGTRAQGMGGAFTAVADDASAVYWNPAGLAAGSYFSLVIDGSAAEGIVEDGGRGASRSGWMLALSMPALGLSYYRLRGTSVTPLDVSPASEPSALEVRSLITHHAGVTLVQSLGRTGIAVGSTLKLVRGVATFDVVSPQPLDDLLDEGSDLLGRASNAFDLDIGVMKAGSFGRIGLVFKNVTEPDFETPQGGELELDRQIRAGAALSLTQTSVLAVDFDLMPYDGPLGEVRQFAMGGEARVVRRVIARAGFRLNTAGETRDPAYTLGGSFAATNSVLIDAQATLGSDEAGRGWGVAGRFVF
jgi:hypothetical protein